MFTGFRLYLCLFFFSIPALAQHPLVINYGKKEGLPSLETYQVYQDKDGFIWVATDCGVAKYDGYQFRIFNTSAGLRNNCVFKIFEDKKKRKWLTTSTNELCYIENDRIVYLPCSDKLANMAGPFAAKRLIVDDQENVYLSHRGKSCYYKIGPPYDNSSVKPVYLDQTIGYGYVEPIGKDFLYGTNGAYLFAKANHKLQLRMGRTIHTVQVMSPFSTHVFSCPVGDGSYLFSEGTHLFRFSEDSAYLLKRFDKNIISLDIHDKNEVWIGFYQGGLERYDLDGFRFVSGMLKEYSVTSSIFDSESNLWVSTLEGGVFSIPQLGTKFLNSSNGLASEQVLTSSVIGDKLAIGSFDGAIRLVEGEKLTGSIKESPYFGNANYVVMPYGDQIFWGGGVGGFLISEGKIHKRIYSALIKTASIGNNGIYLGSVNEVLFYDNHRIKSLGSLNIRITKVFCDSKGKLWVGTNRGLMSMQNDTILPESSFERQFNGKITDIVESPDGTIWVGTNGGGIFRIRNNAVIPYIEMKSNNIISCIYPDPVSKNLWVATSQGVFVIDPVSLKKTHVLTLRQYSFDVTSIARIDNTIYLSTTKGIFMVDADQLLTEQPLPSLYLSSIEANDKQFSSSGVLEIPYSNTRVKFTFKPIIFMGIRPELYKYKLEGADGKWHFTQNNSVEYGFLKPGKYKFSVIAIDESGRFSAKSADYYFRVSSPFYYRTWFIIASGILALAALGLFAYLLIKFSRRKEKIRNDNEVRLADLELKALRAQMNPHFIFNSLNAVQGLILRNDSSGALTFMGKFSKLVRGVLENSEKPLISLSEEIAGLELYLQLEQLKYDHIFNYSITIDDDLGPNQVFLPSMLVQPLVENAIQHGVVGSDRKGNIKITFKRESAVMLLVIVEDNGVGFSNKKQKRVEERISLGMKVTNERLKLLEKRMTGKAESRSEISVNSVLGGGTAVYLKIPVYGKNTIAGSYSR